MYRFRLEAYAAGSGFATAYCPRMILRRPRASEEGSSRAYRGVFERVEGGLAGGAEVACPGAGEKREKGAEVAAGGALVGGDEGGVQIWEVYPIC